jgi:replicative DNA helicase
MGEESDRLFQKAKAELQRVDIPTQVNKRDNNDASRGIDMDRGSGTSLVEYWSNAKRNFEERSKRGSPELPTGFAWIDELTDGIHKGEMWCVSAKTGQGKTCLAMNIARNVADSNKSVLFISLEMTGEELVGRMFSEFTGFNHNRLRLGDFDDSFVAKDKLFCDFINSIDFEIVEKGYKFQDILDVLETAYNKKKPDLVVLDFVQLIDKEGQDDRVALEEFMRKLAELAKTEKIAIMVISQLRRQPSGADIHREPDLQDMKGTGSIEQLSHIVLIIYKVIDKMMGKETEKIFIKIAKNRHGPCGEKEVQFVGENFKFKELNEYKEQLYA